MSNNVKNYYDKLTDKNSSKKMTTGDSLSSIYNTNHSSKYSSNKNTQDLLSKIGFTNFNNANAKISPVAPPVTPTPIQASTQAPTQVQQVAQTQAPTPAPAQAPTQAQTPTPVTPAPINANVVAPPVTPPVAPPVTPPPPFEDPQELAIQKYLSGLNGVTETEEELRRRIAEITGETLGAQTMIGGEPISAGAQTGRKNYLSREALAQLQPLQSALDAEVAIREGKSQEPIVIGDSTYAPDGTLLSKETGDPMNPMLVSQGQQIIDPVTGEVIASGAPKEVTVSTSITEANGRRLLVNKATGETIKDLGEASSASPYENELTKYQNINTAEKLRQNFENTKTFQDYKEITMNAINMNNVWEAYKNSDKFGTNDDNAVGRNGASIAVLTLFQKLLDPGSVVRESEYARAAMGTPLWARMKGAKDALTEGGVGMSDYELHAILSTANVLAASTEKEYARRYKAETDRTASLGLSPEQVYGYIYEPQGLNYGGYTADNVSALESIETSSADDNYVNIPFESGNQTSTKGSYNGMSYILTND